jgi:hypothetical protein
MSSFADKTITVYPSYGYRSSSDWVIPLRVWVHKPRRFDAVSDELVRMLVGDKGPLTAQEIVRCRKCLAPFIADDARRFEGKTDPNGLVEFELRAPVEWAAGWFTVTAEIRQFGKTCAGTGRVRLLEPQGRSVVSDIDDTIKVSEIPAGTRVVLRNTFLREYVLTEGMLDRYKRLGERIGNLTPRRAHRGSVSPVDATWPKDRKSNPTKGAPRQRITG